MKARGWTLFAQCLLLFFICAVAWPQQNADIHQKITDIFNTNPGQATTTTRRPSGFANVVVAEPVNPSVAQPNFNSKTGRQCNCVPYHLCDPTTKTVNEPVEDGAFDGFGLIDIRFDRDDPVCEHFLDTCCESGHEHDESLTPRPQPNRPTGCGVRNVGGIDFNITGVRENESGFAEFPWTIALLHSSNSSYFCSGSLIHPRVVLTAVHCVIGRHESSYLVRAGEWDSQTTRERLPFEERKVQRVISHPQYNPRNVANDFALVILQDVLPIDDHINTICLPAHNAVPLPGTTCYSTGWGKDLFGAAGRYSSIMKRVPLPIVEFNRCQQQFRGTRLGPRFVLDPSFICAGGEKGIDTCQGDGGAPLACPVGYGNDNRYHQSGIVAWGIGCNDEIPAAYANVAAARNWIDEQMLANGFGTTTYTII